MKTHDMNQLWVEDRGWDLEGDCPTLLDNSTRSADGSARAYFRDLEVHLVRHIREAPIVLGCVAWLTSDGILEALAGVQECVAIVVQKEDFLRPDLGTDDGWKRRLRARYDALKNPPDRWQWGGMLGSLSYGGWQEIEPVRCVGNHNRDRRPAFPRMHNKFLVFCQPRRISPEENGDDGCFGIFQPRPYAVWTGSFNFTRNAGMSLENALYLTDHQIVQAYFREWEQIEAISEPLDWEQDWSEPQWRIGS